MRFLRNDPRLDRHFSRAIFRSTSAEFFIHSAFFGHWLLLDLDRNRAVAEFHRSHEAKRRHRVLRDSDFLRNDSKPLKERSALNRKEYHRIAAIIFASSVLKLEIEPDGHSDQQCGV